MSVCREIEIKRIKTQTFKTKIEKNYSKEETRIDSEEDLSNNSSPIKKEKIESFLSFEEDIRNHVNKHFNHNFPIVKKFVNLINFVDFDSEERKDIQKLVSIIENKDESSDSFDQDKTISFTKCNKKSTIDNTPIDVLL